MDCTSPTRIHVNVDGKDTILYVPCGKCPHCRRKKKFEWTVRLIHEAESWKSKAFLTLTYDDSHLPRDCGLHKDELQRFFKRLRKVFEGSGRKIKYFACGEYGDRFGRPHYHAIVFGLDISDLGIVQRVWRNGFVRVLPVTMFRFQYVAGYVQKKLDKESAAEKYGDLQPPFQLQSNGLGKEYCLGHAALLYERGYVGLWTGAKAGLPVYYKRILQDSVGLLLGSDEDHGRFYRHWLEHFHISYGEDMSADELRLLFERKVLGAYEDDNGRIHYFVDNLLDKYVDSNQMRRKSLETRTKNYVDNIRGRKK